MPAGWYEDTDPEALKVFIQLHRQMTPGQRVARIFELTAFQESLQRASVRSMYPHAGEREVFLRVAARRLDRDTMLRVYGGFASVTALAQAFQELLAALDRTETAFLVGGSVASGAHGLARQTNGIDIVVDLILDRVPALCEALGSAFYADAEMVSRAVTAGRPFNLIHLASAYKFDLFPIGSDAFGRSELARRRFTAGSIAGLEDIEFPIASPEDIILAKLVWFRKGGGVSDRQWHDILGVIQVQGERLDRAYLNKWAEQLGVSDLLSEVVR